MVDWREMTRLEKLVRIACVVAMGVKLVERAREEDLLGAVVCGLAAVAALGLNGEEIRGVFQALEAYASSETI